MSPNAGGGGGWGVSANEHSFVHGAQINCGDLTPYLTYGKVYLFILSEQIFRMWIWTQVTSQDPE